MRWWERAAALATLAAVLACSTLGVCWRQFATSCSDECCQQEEDASVATAQPCSSVVSHVSAARVAPPVVVAVLPYPAPLPTLLRPGVAPAHHLPETPPPLVLRI
jgi:hypothetical protein